MFYVPRGLMKRISGGFLISISLPAADLECSIKSLIFNSLRFKETAFKQCPPLLAIRMTWNHLDVYFTFIKRRNVIFSNSMQLAHDQLLVLTSNCLVLMGIWDK